MNIPTICFIFGAGLFGIGIIGGGIQVKEFSIPKVPWFTRFISFALGGFLMILGLGFYINENSTPSPPEPTPSVQPTPQITPSVQPTPQTTPTPTVTPPDLQPSPPLSREDDRPEASDEGYKYQAQPQVKISKPYFGSCGSLAPTSYPAVRYRVYIDYSPDFLEAAKEHLCNDAWVISKAPHNGKKMIVVSSFAEKHYLFAIKFAQSLKDKNFPDTSVQRVVIHKLN